MRTYIEWKNDVALNTRLTDVNFITKEVKYHNTCRLKYQNEAEKTPAGRKSLSKEDCNLAKCHWHIERDVHKTAQEALVSYIEENIITNNEVYFLTNLCRYYNLLLKEIGGEDFKDADTTVQNLTDKIKREFGDRIGITKSAL